MNDITPNYAESIISHRQFNAISHLTRETKLDSVFDVKTVDVDTGETIVYDFENDCNMSLEEGMELLWDGLAYPLIHEGLTEDEAKAVAEVLIGFGIIEEGSEDYTWLLGPDD